MKLYNKIFLGLVLGIVVGLLANIFMPKNVIDSVVYYLINPLGKMWLAGLIMVVIPLIISTLALGVAGISDAKKLGRMGGKTFLLFLILTAISATFGILAMNVVTPGNSIDPQVKTELMEAFKGETTVAMGMSDKAFSIDLFIKIIPRNPIKAAADGDMLAMIFIALILGLALARLPKNIATPMMDFLSSVSHITTEIIAMVMKVAPLGVFCLISGVISKFGLGLLLSLSYYVIVVISSMLLFSLIVYPLILILLAKRNPVEFFSTIRLVLITSFSTSSSNATLPTTMQVTINDLKVKKEVAAFVLPLGATMNMNGTALFEGVTVLFLAQVFGVELSIFSQMLVVLMSVITAIGVAGIPGGSIPLLMMVLGMVGIPMEGIAIILGVDRILDMCRTVINVTGDVVVATVIDGPKH